MDRIPRKLKKAMKKVIDNNIIGFSGRGQTLLDIIVKCAKVTWREMRRLKPLIDTEKKRRWNCFREASIEVTGEDPDTKW